MNLWFRTLLTVLFARFKAPLGVMEEGRMRLRVWPTDLDIAVHVNNGRYLSIADLGRWEMLLRTGFWPKMRARGWHPVVGTSKVWHRRSLMPFQTFDLTTRILGWDEKWTYIEHRFEGTGKKADTVYCRIVVKTLFLHGREKVPTQTLIETMGFDGQSPALEDGLEAALQ